MTNEEKVEEANAVFTAGELGGLSFKLNIKAMEKFLETRGKDPSFRYLKLCQAAVDFAKAIQGIK